MPAADVSRSRALPKLLALGLTVAVLSIVSQAVLTWRSAEQHRKAAESTLRDFAGVALDRYTGAVELRLRQSLAPTFGVLGAGLRPRPGDGLADLREMSLMPQELAADPCECLPVLRAQYWFRVNLGDGTAMVIDSAGHRTATPPWLGDVATRLTALGAEVRFANVMTGSGDSARMIYAIRLADSGGATRQIYGFSVPVALVATELFDRTFRETRLSPRFLPVDLTNPEYLTIAVRTPEGGLLYRSPVEWRSPHADSVQLRAHRATLWMGATLNPAYVDRLIVGGLPRSPVRAILVSTGLTLVILLGVGGLAWHMMALGRLRGDFAASVTHELRTPLTQIRLSAETLLMGRARGPEDRRSALQEIVTETERLQHLVDTILHFSQAERQPVSLAPEDGWLAPLVEDTVRGFAPIAARHGVQLVAEVPSPLAVRVDPRAFRQVLLNLLDNAVRYGPDGQSVVITAASSDDRVTLTVADHGAGIPARERQRVWKPFVRLDPVVGSTRTGSGLGLAVVRQLVTASGGDVAIESNEPSGTRVLVSFPRGRSLEGSGSDDARREAGMA